MTTDGPDQTQTLLRNQWLRLGLVATVASVVAVLVTEAAARAVWPEIALFQPLDSYGRSIVFTVVPVVFATAVYYWQTRRSPQPERTFVAIAAVVLVVSIIPDYLLPVANKTLLASTVTASLHVVAGVVTVAVLLIGYRRFRPSS